MRFLPVFLAALVLPSIAWAEDPPAPQPAPPAPPPAPFWTGPRMAASIVMATGVGAIVAGAVYAARSDEANAATKPHCLTSDPDKCDAEGYALRDKSTVDGRVATTALGVGAAGVFLGLVLAWVNPEVHPSSPTPAKVSIAPLLGAEQRGIVVLGRF
ncbi:hypothetical protein [Polyangium sp. 6x1]|uniref:hypothetical protein n=1 Tax=Polyangium sp. 6x1 TaxID=3042689 RepID=UPI0024832773|nr:hypothetical protein [Polyangium sp. 6x1]MDI1450400.1 hypothetical protein [Polyangium sp. 6x1]